MKRCKKCQKLLNNSKFYIQKKTCKNCCRQKQKEYRQKHKEQIKQLWEKYYQRHKTQVKKRMDKYNKKYRERINLNGKKYYQEHTEQEKQYSRNYYKTDKGKLSCIQKSSKRKRNLSFELLFANPFKCPVDYHHISDAFVVALPRSIHRANLGEKHREKLKPIVEKLYNISYVIKEK